MSKTLFSIEQGTFALALTNPGVPLPGVSPSDYDVGGAADSFQCQITNAALTASPNSTTEDVPATMCGPGGSNTIVQATSYTLDLGYLQDPNVADGLSAYLFEHDAQLAYFYFGGVDSKGHGYTSIGALRLQSGAIGGDMRTTLSATISLPVTGKPDTEFGSGTPGANIVLGDNVAGGGTGPAPAPPVGAVAGAPGSWTAAAGSTLQVPADLAAAQALVAGGPVNGFIAPTVAWAVGDYVIVGTNTHIHWDDGASDFATGDA